MVDESQALIVDSDEVRAGRLAAICRDAGLAPVIVADGEQALLAVDGLTGTPWLVTQLGVPNVDAFTVITHFRGRFPADTGAQVVALSAFPELRAAARARQAELGLGLIMVGDPAPEPLVRAIQQLRGGGGEELGGQFTASVEDSGDVEERRRELIRRSGLDRLPLRPPDAELQQFMQDVARKCGSPIALMTVALAERLVFPARSGLDAVELDRYTSLCNKVIEAGEPLFVPDAENNPAFNGNGLVKAGVIRGYASAPFYLGEGPPVGTVCLINSSAPLRLDLAQVRSLRRAASELGELLVARNGEDSD